MPQAFLNPSLAQYQPVMYFNDSLKQIMSMPKDSKPTILAEKQRNAIPGKENFCGYSDRNLGDQIRSLVSLWERGRRKCNKLLSISRNALTLALSRRERGLIRRILMQSLPVPRLINRFYQLSLILLLITLPKQTAH